MRYATMGCLLMIGMVGTSAAAASGCAVGVYRTVDGTKVILTDRAAPGAAPDYRYTLLDGRRGSADSADSPYRCGPDGVRARSSAGWSEPLTRVAISETPTHFDSLETKLYGVLIEPADAPADRPLVVFVHGSEKTSDIGISYPYVFAAQGISVFMYDKRGTGSSDGFYTQNFQLLAEDAVAASQEARRLAKSRYGRWGYFGGSQGGWVAPLAARIGGADFVAVGFGLVLSPLEEDREQVFFELRRKGYGDDVIAKAGIVTTAVDALITSRFTAGYDALDAVKRRYAATPWLGQIEGEFTGRILRSDPEELQRTGAALFDGLGIQWNYDASAVIGGISTPQLWVLADSDRDAPGDLTRERLDDFIEAGRPIDLFVFRHTDHGITEYVEAPDGSRTTTRVADGYYRLLGDWINGRWSPPYGDSDHVGAR